jgi:hypothetical protein
MSQGHIRKSAQPEPVIWWKVALACVGLAFVSVALFLVIIWFRSFPPAYERATGKVLEIREVVDKTVDSLYGGKIIYGVEAHVQYVADGQLVDRWMRASDDLPREAIILKLATHPTQCTVYWLPNHPENAKCSLK